MLNLIDAFESSLSTLPSGNFVVVLDDEMPLFKEASPGVCYCAKLARSMAAASGCCHLTLQERLEPFFWIKVRKPRSNGGREQQGHGGGRGGFILGGVPTPRS